MELTFGLVFPYIKRLGVLAFLFMDATICCNGGFSKKNGGELLVKEVQSCTTEKQEGHNQAARMVVRL